MQTESQRQLKTIFCRHCETVFEWPILPGRPRLYCSTSCRRNADKLLAAEKYDKERRVWYFLDCGTCNKPVKTVFKHQRFCSQKCRQQHYSKKAVERYWASRPERKKWVCGWCNEELWWPTQYNGSCAYHDDCRKQAKQAENRKKNAKRGGARLSGEKFSHEDVAARDNYVCYLCGDRVDMTISRLDNFGANLDHVIPISRGGVDSFDNVKLTHRICNIKKSNKLLEEVLSNA
jgi:hypothetical protein